MDKDLIVSYTKEETRLALMEDKRLVEYHKEKNTNHYSVGDIVVGQVKKIMPGLNATFVDVADEKNGFMHYLDLGPHYNSVCHYLKLAMNGDANMETLQDFTLDPVFPKVGNIADTLTVGQYILVQITKEPISTKGPKLSCDISLAGHYIVLTPFSNKVSVSQKIKNNDERNRLRRLIQSIRPQNFGVIVRTNAEGHNVSELDADLRRLTDQWATMTRKLKNINTPTRVHAEPDSASSMIRDVLTDDFTAIYIDNEDLYNEARAYVRSIDPNRIDIVHLYKMQTPIFEQFGVTRDIRRSFGRIVTIRSGVYLYIEHTEAMHVIDVNSGNHIKSGSSQEDTTIQVNIESAKEIARQIRLRDMGGIIIIDFVDMTKAENRKKLFDVMTEEMRRDKARHTILPLSKFGLMQITRQRVRPSVEVNVQETCPLCGGSGTIKSSLVIVDDIEANLSHLLNSQVAPKHLTIITHPYVQAYLTKGLFHSVRQQWMRRYKVRLTIKAQESFSLLEYKFFNANGEELILQ